MLGTVAYQAPLSVGFSRQDYWSRLLHPLPADLPNPGVEPMSLTSPALADGTALAPTWEAPKRMMAASKFHPKQRKYLEAKPEKFTDVFMGN